MFATISRDTEALERRRPGGPDAVDSGPSSTVNIRILFRYRRIDNGSRKGSDAIAVTWDVIAFRLLEHDLP